MDTGFFITGTDTDAGKTLVALSLIRALQNQGYSVAGMKPVSAGCRMVNDQLSNDDALALQQISSVQFSYEIINPFAFEPAIAPHLAAQQQGIPVTLEKIESAYREITKHVDKVIVEGAGGWLVPMDEQHSMADLAERLQLSVILVVGLRLGCLNHALLTMESITTRGLTLKGWVANEIDPAMEFKQQNIETLKRRIEAPLIGTVPYQQTISIDNTADLLDVQLLER